MEWADRWAEKLAMKNLDKSYRVKSFKKKSIILNMSAHYLAKVQSAKQRNKDWQFFDLLRLLNRFSPGK